MRPCRDESRYQRARTSASRALHALRAARARLPVSAPARGHGPQWRGGRVMNDPADRAFEEARELIGRATALLAPFADNPPPTLIAVVLELPTWDADALRAVADVLYPPGDPRTEPWHPIVATNVGRLRHALRTAAD